MPSKIIKRKIKDLSLWDWTTLVASWRYYEHGQSIHSSQFPNDVISRFWTSGKYDDNVLNQIARQFAYVEHLNGEQEWINLHKRGVIRECDARVWCKFYAFCKAWHYHEFKTLIFEEDISGVHFNEEDECFYCEYTKRWYSKQEYLKNPWLECYCREECIKEIR